MNTIVELKDQFKEGDIMITILISSDGKLVGEGATLDLVMESQIVESTTPGAVEDLVISALHYAFKMDDEDKVEYNLPDKVIMSEDKKEIFIVIKVSGLTEADFNVDFNTTPISTAAECLEELELTIEDIEAVLG